VTNSLLFYAWQLSPANDYLQTQTRVLKTSVRGA
jgi:hypothetical protein